MAGITGAAGSFNVGNSCAIVINHPLAPNGQLQVPNITGFKCSQEVTTVQSMRLDGVNLTARLPKGWKISLMADRGGSSVDDLIALIEAVWYGTQTMVTATMFQYVNELDGSRSTYQFDGVSLSLPDAGDWKGDAIVKQMIEGEAFRRRRV